ncbi:lactate 2-monooxygenase [Bailinhaonella thermotolerans]|uniref:Alpha-hydroxy-acid oxidizing protein n=1 Tax=Bailinhaonella thermotolerans TaxID=1070861 RepID=A0A3A4B2V3_9ACTN|nr:lactate 2-monooxygenase [Bailinhaonella thermotolerans]RJL34518.1 alpha-hydroxy-acid oxidizing protein [Bailinhaonella thermotolerans]
MSFADFQQEIYVNGLLTGALPPHSVDPAVLEEVARRRLGEGPYWYVAGSAGTGATERANREAFGRRRIVPRMLVDATERDLGVELFGERLPAPVLLAPVGVQSIVHPEGELATARAAASLGVPSILSTMASHTIEEVAAAAGEGPRWFQLYWPHDDEVTVSLLSRARKAGFTALVVTLDTWTLGWRPHDLDLAYLPFLRGEGLAIPFSDPAFLAGLEKSPQEDLGAAVLRWAPMFNGRAHTWDRLALLRDNWDGPIVLKGIQSADDARRAADHGMDGVVVSNHGGRQVDGAIASLDALEPVAEAVGDRLTVLFDSGVRTGADVLKALALGARAVLLGRPYLWGLACGGADGVRHVLRCLLAELDISMGLAGHRAVAGLAPDCLEVR